MIRLYRIRLWRGYNLEWATKPGAIMWPRIRKSVKFFDYED